MSKKKSGADAVQENAIGHNKVTKEMQAEFCRLDGEYAESIAIINDKRKENLRDAKDAGMSKMAIRKATKEMRMSSEARQVAKEVEAEKEHYIAICREVGIFDTMEAA